MFYTHVKKLFSNDLLLTQMEKCALMEALVLISNQFKDFSKQEAFLEELMAPIRTHWLSEEMTRYVYIWVCVTSAQYRTVKVTDQSTSNHDTVV